MEEIIYNKRAIIIIENKSHSNFQLLCGSFFSFFFLFLHIFIKFVF